MFLCSFNSNTNVFTYFCILFLTYFIYIDATISDNFQKFLRNQYGEKIVTLLARKDVGGGGSFGGGTNHVARKQTNKRPVILIHGITNTAGTFGKNQKYFLEHGYKDEEVYGTTYGDGGKTSVLFVKMECHYTKVIRILIQAVAEYTNSTVNVIAYSMGSPIARKAIKGQRCVDTNENLGQPLTNLIYTFVGVAGANYGSFLCIFPFGSCNSNNGMSCGSQFLNDINSSSQKEATFVYSIFSTGDDKVGYFACGRQTSSIARENKYFLKKNLDHDGVMYKTIDLQYNLVTKNKA